MKRLLEKLFGWHFCHTFTKWEQFKGNFSRPACLGEPGYTMNRTLEYTRRWQERKCTDCGKMEVESLPNN